ncbi:acyl-CoA thioesterase [Aerophototrophica crusticola]
MANPEMPDLTSPGAFRFWVPEHVRFSDLDPVGHVNNNAIGVYLETGRLGFHDEAGVPTLCPHGQPVLRSVATEFLAELHRPAGLRVGVGILAVGNTSWTIGSAVFHGDRCIATNRSVLVMIDRQTRRPTPVPDSLRARFLSFSF